MCMAARPDLDSIAVDLWVTFSALMESTFRERQPSNGREELMFLEPSFVPAI